MKYTIQCPCGQQMTVDENYTGKEVLCVACRRALRVPASAEKPGEVVPAEMAQESLLPAAPPQSAQQPVVRPNRAGLVFALGLIAVLNWCIAPFVGIPAWIMANADLKAMRSGAMDRYGEQLTEAGRVCAIVGMCIMVLGILAMGVYFGFLAAMFGATRGMRMH